MKINTDITKRQHYVWRAYLRAWCSKEDDKIFSLIIDSKKIIKTDLMNVAQEKYFYEFNKITKEEKKFLESFVKDKKNTTQSIISDLIQILSLTQGLKELKKEVDTFLKEEKEDKVLDSIDKNGFEQFHSHFEKEGAEFIKIRDLNDLKKMEVDEFKFKSLLFLCIQYFRTKKRKLAAIEAFKGSKINMRNIYNIVSIILALQLNESIALDDEIRYTLLSIDNDMSFISGDQPVINLDANKIDEEGNIIGLRFYYPLSPKIAIIIEFDASKEVYNLEKPEKDRIIELNNLILKNANKFIFSTNKEILENYT